jgi:predicted NBD/HSP70 family sugar kinase
MKSLFNHDLTDATNQSRLMQQKLRIIKLISQNGHGITIPDICKELKISTPTGIKLVNNLQKEGFLAITGKKETVNGRKPLIYDLKNVNFYALSVEVLINRITAGIIDSHLNTLYYRQKTDFVLENNSVCLKIIEDFIHECLLNSEVKEEFILGMGVGITGQVNHDTSETVTYFNFLELPLGEYLSKSFSIPVFVNNSTRCIGLAEKIAGKARGAQHALVVNLSRVLGCSIIIDNKIFNGASGMAGELEHINLGSTSKKCHCGKTGCIGTQVGGSALEIDFMDHMKAGEYSNIKITDDTPRPRYDTILSAALKGDKLSLSLTEEMGQQLGMALGNIINILNPSLIIIAGKFSPFKKVLSGPISQGISHSALKSTLQNCQIEFSELGELGGLKGAGALVFENFELIR